MPNTTAVAGIDVGKSSLDAHVEPSGATRHCSNDKCDRRALRNWLLSQGVTRVVFEPTGRYHRGLHQSLCDAGLGTVLANPLHARRFAQALGRRAKNDKVDAAIQAAIDTDETLSRRAAIIRSIPGFGSLNAASLCADMPALGSIDRRPAAALSSVAPFDNQSGGFQGTRRCRGGRAHPRKLLYMAALSGRGCYPACKALYERLVAKGSEPKLALVAVMRKLLNLVNALLRDDRLFQPEAPSREALAGISPPTLAPLSAVPPRPAVAPDLENCPLSCSFRDLPLDKKHGSFPASVTNAATCLTLRGNPCPSQLSTSPLFTPT